MAENSTPVVFPPSVPTGATNTSAMVNKRDKNEGAKKKAANTATAATPAAKLRAVTKPKAATRIAEPTPASAAPKASKKKETNPAATPAVRSEDIAFRAYLIGEKRQQLGLPGDALGDWVEAERQLLTERATHGVN